MIVGHGTELWVTVHSPDAVQQWEIAQTVLVQIQWKLCGVWTACSDEYRVRKNCFQLHIIISVMEGRLAFKVCVVSMLFVDTRAAQKKHPVTTHARHRPPALNIDVIHFLSCAWVSRSPPVAQVQQVNWRSLDCMTPFECWSTWVQRLSTNCATSDPLQKKQGWGLKSQQTLYETVSLEQFTRGWQASTCATFKVMLCIVKLLVHKGRGSTTDKY